MKKTIVMLAILLIPVFSMQAGIRIGAKAGINLANASFNKDAVKTDNFTGFQIGPIVEISGLGGFGVDAAILYNKYGLKVKEGINPLSSYRPIGDDQISEEKIDALDIPVNLKMKFSVANVLGLYLSAGPYIRFKLDNKVSFNQIKTQWESKTFGAGLNFGTGVELLKNLQIGVNYQLDLSDSYVNFSKDDLKDLKGKTRIWSITAAYFF